MLTGPALFWAAYHYYKDRHNPEPFHILLLMFGLGVLSGFIANLIYIYLAEYGYVYDVEQLARDDRIGLLVYSIVVIGGVEELAKLFPFYFLAIRHAHFNERLDGIIYASLIALGFATFENFYYLQIINGLEALGRAIASPLVHVMFSSVWGYIIGRAVLAGRSIWLPMLLGLTLAMLLHGLFDFFTFGINEWYRIGPPLIIITIWIWRMRLFHHVRAKDLGKRSG